MVTLKFPTIWQGQNQNLRTGVLEYIVFYVGFYQNQLVPIEDNIVTQENIKNLAARFDEAVKSCLSV
ncbi:hypothetical protein SAMN05216302_1006131 [Nitrosomonas aestuarii]|uniref:Uncharacterized protein n=1 Tax=Nitrosomonas aestuarii TaxID=52441 RepID=A0A1I3ZLA3_9PROT|nr:hypothetical protein [Nitrosomonas aestuarii]SFK44319.1 hypothetical protein SAMN05216302_1006131 [Nitrosomonas aestuarii]